MKIPGNTKLVELTHIEETLKINNRLFAKVENSNPSGSVKDRAVYYILLDLKERGLLKENTTIIEATSGNTGISLAYYSKEFGYRLVIYMPASMSEQRRTMIRSLGAELVLVNGPMLEAERQAIEAVENDENAVLFDQFNNKVNVKAHYMTTGPEILKDLPSVDYFVAGFGTGGTITGASKFLKEHKEITSIGVEPLESPLLTKGVAGGHKIQGIGANFIPSILDKNMIDHIVDVPSEEAIHTAKVIRELEGLDIGISSGAALLGALVYIKQNNIENKDFVIIFPDKGDRYSW